MKRLFGLLTLPALVASALVIGAGTANAVVVNTRVLVWLQTGGDDLRGGNDNLNMTLNFRVRSPFTKHNVNESQNWGNNSWHLVTIENPAGTPEFTKDDIANLELTTTFTGGWWGDNWNLDTLRITFEETHHDGRIVLTDLYRESGLPLFRFTFTNFKFIARRDLLLDGSFEAQQSRTLTQPWAPEGVDPKGVDIGLGFGCLGCGNNNAFIASSVNGNWNAIWQTVPLKPNRNYRLRGSLRTTPGVNTLFFGVRLPGVWQPIELHLGPIANYQVVDVIFPSGDHTAGTVFVGFWGVGTPEFVQVDQVSLLET